MPTPSPADIQRAEHEGRFIEAGWLTLYRDVLASGSNPVTDAEVSDFRRTFYAGAIHMLYALRATNQQDALRRVEMAHSEIDAFTAQVQAGMTR